MRDTVLGPGYARRRRGVAVVLAAVLGVAVPAAGDESDAPGRARPSGAPVVGAPTPDRAVVWRLERQGVTIEQNVGHLPEAVRAVLLDRLVADGWTVVPIDAVSATGTTPSLPRLLLDSTPPPARIPPTSRPSLPKPPAPTPPTPSRAAFAGGELVAPEAEGAGWRVALAPPESLLAALGFEVDDRILAFDEAADRAAVERAAARLRETGQLALIVARRGGGVDRVEITPVFQPAPRRPMPGRALPRPAEQTEGSR